MKKDNFNLNPKVNIPSSEKERNKKFVDRFFETILFSILGGIVTSLNFGVAIIIAIIWTIGGVIVAIKKPEDLFIQVLWNFIANY